MPIRQSNFFVVTGGPGAGKTTLIEALGAHGFGTVEEAGRRIIREQNAVGGKATHDGDRLAYRNLMFEDAVRTFQEMTPVSDAVFFDRGLPDMIGYSRLIGKTVPHALSNAVQRYRYSRTVFVAPPWEDIYGRDAERKQDFAESVATCDAMRSAYGEAGYTLVDLPRAAVEERVAFVVERAQAGGIFVAQSGKTPGSMPKTTGPRT